MRPDASRRTFVDGPVGAFVDRTLAARPDIAALVESPGRRLAFRAFASIRLGRLLGQAEVGDAGHWVDVLAACPELRRRLEDELRVVAELVAADPRLAEEKPRKPDADFGAVLREARPGRGSTARSSVPMFPRDPRPG